MNYSNFKNLITALMEKHNGNITMVAKEFAEIRGIPYSDKVRRGISKVVNRHLRDNSAISKQMIEQVTKSEEKSDGTGYVEAVTHKQPKTLEDAIRIGQIDLDIWEVDRWVWNSWGVTSWKSGKPEERTNYQVKLWLKRRDKSSQERLEEILELVKGYTPTPIKFVPAREKTGVVVISDLHLGAKVKDLIRTKDFDLGVLQDMLQEVAERTNRVGFKEVKLIMLGDYFESLSGLNHLNTFKSLDEDMWGANPIIAAHIVLTHFLSSINNLTGVYMVSGNHDRMTADNKIDNTGEGGKILWYLLRQTYPELDVMYHNSVLSVVLDDINYILTHGDKGYSKKDFSKFILDYGIAGHFKLSLQGHWHSRTTFKVYATERKMYDEVEVVSRDEVDYRRIVCPPIFSGNWHSESEGYSSTPGFLIMWNNGKGKPNIMDISL